MPSYFLPISLESEKEARDLAKRSHPFYCAILGSDFSCFKPQEMDPQEDYSKIVVAYVGFSEKLVDSISAGDSIVFKLYDGTKYFCPIIATTNDGQFIVEYKHSGNLFRKNINKTDIIGIVNSVYIFPQQKR